MILTEKEFNALTHAIEATGMDCWFEIRQDVDEDGEYDYVYDLENDIPMSLEEGIYDAKDGFVNLDSLGLTEEEIEIVDEICNRVGGSYDGR